MTDETRPGPRSLLLQRCPQTGSSDKESSMRKLIVTEFISVDGVIEAPGGEPGYPH